MDDTRITWVDGDPYCPVCEYPVPCAHVSEHEAKSMPRPVKDNGHGMPKSWVWSPMRAVGVRPWDD